MQPPNLFKTSLFGLSLMGLLLSGPVPGEGPLQDPLSQTRQRFVAAEKALEQGQLFTYRRLKGELQGYPLLPYLEYRELTRQLASRSPDAIRQFLEQQADTPLSSRLRAAWLDLLAKQGRWSSYLEFARPGGSIQRQCQRLHALIETGKAEQAFPAVPDIWLSGRSRPKACDPVFDAWIGAGGLTQGLVWRRIGLAMRAGRTHLAGYLKRFLDTDERPWVERWISLHHHPERVIWLTKEPHPWRNEIIVHALRRLARNDPAQAITLWEQFQKNAGFSDRQQLRLARSLAAHLLQAPDQRLYRRLEQLLPKRLRLDPRLSDRRFQIALRQHDWDRVLLTIDSMDEAERGKARWRYWRARSLQQLGRSQEASGLLSALAKERSYYGFLAADRLGTHFSFANQALDIPATQVRQLAQLPALRRARELQLLGRLLEARREWNLGLRSLDTQGLKAAARLAQTWDWPSQAIQTLAKLRAWNDLELRFPLVYRQQVDEHAHSLGLDSAWIYAILRQESGFVTDARSSAGAMGLMQLMPHTAREVARHDGRGPLQTGDLLRPQLNIELGSSYLNQIYRRLGDHPVLATAAYNAGPSRVLEWLPAQSQATDEWIETIPVRETREYLKRVFSYTLIYAHRLGEDTSSLPAGWLRPIQAMPPADPSLASDA